VAAAQGLEPLSASRSPLAPTLARGAPEATIEEAALAASSLVALPGAGFSEAALRLEAMAETATRRRLEKDMA